MDDEPVVETGFTSRTEVEPPQSFAEQANVDGSDARAFEEFWSERRSRAACSTGRRRSTKSSTGRATGSSGSQTAS